MHDFRHEGRGFGHLALMGAGLAAPTPVPSPRGGGEVRFGDGELGADLDTLLCSVSWAVGQKAERRLTRGLQQVKRIRDLGVAAWGGRGYRACPWAGASNSIEIELDRKSDLVWV